MSDAEDRLAVARTRLILDQPFLGALVLRLPLKAAGAWCRTTATDARAIHYNPRWIESLSTAQVQFALAHEALHCALGHFARRGHRVQRRWDLACDFAINPLLAEQGLTPPPDAVVLDLYRGMAAEEIYPCLDDSLDNETLDDHVWDEDAGEGGAGGTNGNRDSDSQGHGGGSREQEDENAGGQQRRPGRAGSAGDGDGPPPPLTAREKDRLQQQWQRHLAAAAQRAREAGKLKGLAARLAEAALAPQVSWRALMAQHLSQIARDDYSWLRPSRRESASDGPLMPSLHSRQGDIAVAIDTSGSIDDAALADFLAELNAIKGTQPVRITLFACDAQLAPEAPWVVEPWDELRLLQSLGGGGGTAFTPVFDWLRDAGQQPDVLIYFTDGEGEFPPGPPSYPVLWLVKGPAPVPWGLRVALN